MPFTPADVRFTKKGETIYAFLMAWPEGEIRIRSLGSNEPHAPRRIGRVALLGSDQKLNWRRTPEALMVEMPRAKPCDYVYTVKIT